MMFYAGGFIYLPQTKELLLHLRDGKTQNNPHLWAFFGGLAEEAEKPKETFKRELLEELGISVDKIEYLCDYFNPDFNTHRYVYFVCLEEKPAIILGEGEKTEWFKLEDVFDQNLSKRTKEDLQYFKSHIKTSE